MKILAFVDVHGRMNIIDELVETAKSEKPDVLIDAGDISNLGKNLIAAIEKLSSTGIPLLIIHGNHETASGMREACSKFKNVFFLHNGSYEIGGFVFFGHGGGGFARVDENFENAAAKFLKNYDRKKKLIFVSHAPVYRTRTDYLRGEHRGNESYRKFVDKAKPRLVICGHFHENAKMNEGVGESFVVNPGSHGLLFKLE